MAVVDIPIGLPTGGQVRTCDLEARKFLGGSGASRVFLAPPRETLPARNASEFQKMYKRATGKGAGYPVWGIVPKLIQADEIMSADLQFRIREFHPELAWFRAAGRLLDRKHSKEGLKQRETILKRCVPGLSDLKDWRAKLGTAAKLDDVFDALIGLRVAQSIAKREAPPMRIPENKYERGSRGLLMEMWY